MQSSVLILTQKKILGLTIGADVLSHIKGLFPLVANHLETVIIDSDLFSFSQIQFLLENIQVQSPNTRKILSVSSLDVTQILQIMNQFEIFKILKRWDCQELESLIVLSKEAFYQLKQSEDLIGLHKEQNSKLQNLRGQLEEHIQKRTTLLETAKQRALESHRQLKILIKTIVQVQAADSFKDIERGIQRSLGGVMQLEKVKIQLQSKPVSINRPDEKNDIPVSSKRQYVFELPEFSGFILYKTKEDFKPYQKKLLRQISEAVILTVNKILGRDKTEVLRKQWESIFYSIVYPIAIIDEDFHIIQFNKRLPQGKLRQKKCYQILFNRLSPCEGCQMKQKGGHFKVSNFKKHVEVLSHKFSNNPLSYVNIYKDITEQVFLEKQVLEKAKVSELGTIGSSIAHELNNPLSGIRTLLQIITEDLSDGSQYKDDILQMEKATKNCLEIINNLLHFSRMSTLAGDLSIDMKDLLQKIIYLNELKTKPRGLQIKIQIEGDHHTLALKADKVQHILTQFVNVVTEFALQNRDISLKKSYQKSKPSKVNLKNTFQILISFGMEGLFYKVTARVLLDEPYQQGEFGLEADFTHIKDSMLSLDGDLILDPYDGKKVQVHLMFPLK